ncbi:hypothetical protein A8N53_15985 [Listeria monocytogenes]|nr:hypothetical protein [Listeria monocytogenes]
MGLSFSWFMQPTQIYWQICTKCLWNEFLSFKEKNYKPKIEWRMYMWGPKRLREICIDKDYKFP